MRRITVLGPALALAGGLLLPASGSAQITLNQVDTFQGSSSTVGWGTGAGAPTPTVITTGGPAGAGDQYMQLASDGGAGAGSRLTVFNRAQWLGNYNAAGVNAIEMDLLSPSSNPATLTIRVAYKTTTAAGSSGYSTADAFAFSLPNDGQWHHAVFRLNNTEMAPVLATNGTSPTTPFSTFISSPGEMRLLHSDAPSINGTAVVAMLGVDNIRARFIPIPEPSGVLAAVAAAVAAARLVRRRRWQVAAP